MQHWAWGTPNLLHCPQHSPPPRTVTAAQPRPFPHRPLIHRAQIVYAQGQLQVVADNSSLNQILRDIAQQTGMKITGGVVDQRVFGKYGPGAPAEILATLLNGTGCNMLLREAQPTPRGADTDTSQWRPHAAQPQRFRF